ncbi:eCIS core domain-containing protein, partial [Parapedobacter tibetensis]|uniref:eCIS core domain-containing protein n=1 Tax=Parapedobacter tibetensis TaxID=2972951 RepID=UPI00214D90AD
SINALAYTTGNNIVFGHGQYQPESDSSRRLIAHELTHVVQQVDAGGNRAVQRQSADANIERRYGLGMRNRFGLFDVELNRDTKTLTLIMRVRFNFTGAWPSVGDQQTWITDFIRHVQDRWSYRFYLVPMDICLNAHDTFFARVNVISVTGDQHYTIDVDAASRRSTVNSSSRTARLDALDNDMVTRNRLGQDFQQRPSEHEFGHMLGLPHIECDPSTGVCSAGDQYGDTIAERSDIMGSGWIVSERDYTPFTTAMYYFTGCNWRASHTRVYPIGDYPSPSSVSNMA